MNPNDGLIVQVNDLFYPEGDENSGTDPNVAHIAYTNSFDGATSTQLFGIDTQLDILVTQANSAGTLGTVGDLGLDINNVGGFDISGDSGIGYGAFQTTGKSISSFYTVDLETGLISLVGQIGGGSRITALTVQSNVIPEPASAAILFASSLCLLRRKRS